MGGPHSRDYDFLSGSAGMDWEAALTGISAAAGVQDMDANCLANDPITNAHLYTLWVRNELPMPAAALSLAVPPAGSDWRVAQSSYAPAVGAIDPTNGSDWTLYQSATATLGTSSLFYCAQDRMVLAQLPTHVPQVSVVADRFDAPYGVDRGGDCGHDDGKPTHMKATIAAVQDKGLALVMQDLTMALESTSGCGSYSSIAVNVVFPASAAGVDAVYTGAAATRVANTAPGAPNVSLAMGDNTVAVRAAGGIVAFRVPFADGLRGFSPRSVLKFDGPHGVARLAVYLYEGPAVSFPASPPPSRSVTLMAVGAASSDAEAAAFVAAFAALAVDNQPANASDWRCEVSPPAAADYSGPLPPGFGSTLSASMWVPNYKRILSRRVNGSNVHVPAPGALEITASDGSVSSFRPADFGPAPAPTKPPAATATPPIKIACIGDSITAGTCSWNGYTWPHYVQLKLGANFSVANFGVSGRTMLKADPNSYWNTGSWLAAQNFSADIYTIMLGTNDAKSSAWLPCAPPWLETCKWEGGDNYTSDFIEMVSLLQSQPQKPRVFVISPPPVYSDGKYGINQTIVNYALPVFLPNIVAHSAAQPTVVPVFEALGGANLTKGQWTCDGIHPNDGGYEEIGNVVSAALIAVLKRGQ